MMLARLFCAAALMTAGACASAQEDGEDPGGARASADALLETVRAEDGAPGVMAAVMRDGEMLWSGAVGYADLEADVALTESTRLRVGSVSKPLTAALVLRLAEQGRMDLDADVREAIPELVEPETGVITARRLAFHTAGIRQYDFSNYLDANNVYFHRTLSEALQRYAGDPLVSQPGEAFHYSSLGYNILGVAAERAADQGYAELLAGEVAAPLELADTMIDHPLAIIENRSRFYTRFPDGSVLNTIWRDSSDYYPSGGLLSTARDLAVFTDAVFGGDWLSAESMALVLDEAETASGEAIGRSFGWRIVRDEDGAVRYYGHGGLTNGATAELRYYPEHDLVVAGVMNMNVAAGENVFTRIIGEDLTALFMDDASPDD